MPTGTPGATVQEHFVPLQLIQDLHQRVHDVLAARLAIEWRVRQAGADRRGRLASTELILAE